MKTKRSKPKNKTVKWVFGALLASVLLCGMARADDGVNGNPFTDGTTPVRLTPTEKQSLLQYADNSRTKLQNALDAAQGSGFAGASQIYLKAIKDVIVDSFKDAPRSELLMRIALNQALELTYGVPTADGKGIAQAGVLQGTSNQDLLTVVLEDSIKLAQSYYQDDRTAIQNGSLLDLPYMRLAENRLTLSRKWMASIMEPTAVYEFEVATLQQFLNTAASTDQQHRAYFAEELTLVDDLVGEYSTQAPSDPTKLMGDIRVLRGEIKKLEASVGQKLAAESQPAGTSPSGSANGSGGAASAGGNALGMSFVAIQPGTFEMGSPTSEAGRGSDELQHPVSLTHEFEMQTTDVTQAEWVKVMGSNPSSFQSSQYCPNTFTQVNGVSMCQNNPVEQVSWDDTQQFISKVNSGNSDGYIYRLPTEAEWEYAARAGTTTAYYFGNDASQISAYGWDTDNSGAHTHEVAQLHPNAYGLYDMAGNVWQWASDWYGDYSTSQVTDPTGPSSGSGRVIRGGGWLNGASGLRSAYRFFVTSGDRGYLVGFRLVRTRQ